jgi:glycine cleavage system regulatory protein
VYNARPMNVSLIMTIIGPDRPGLVESVAAVVAAHEGNWLESRMSRLAGQFAGICRVMVHEQNSAALQEALHGLTSTGLNVTVEVDGGEVTAAEGRLVQLELIGHDRPGIVRQISESIASRGVNVEELTTECSSAPMTGETLFRAVATLRLGSEVDLDQLKTDLESIGQDLAVDVSIQETT